MKRICIFLLVLGMLIQTSQDVFAFVQFDAEAEISNVSLSPSSGTIEYAVRNADSISITSNSLGELVNDSMFTVPIATSSSAVTFASASGLADTVAGALNSEVHGTIPDTTIASSVNISINLIGENFLVAGGTGSVDVTVSFAYSSLLHGIADQYGDFWGNLDMGFVIYDVEAEENIWVFEFQDEISGANQEITSERLSEILTDTVSLEFERQYIAYLHDMSNMEINNVPEPSTFLMLCAGLAGVGLFRKRFKN
jgi:hypothetical protein